MIRHLSTSFDGSMIVAAQFERVVEIWDIDSCRHKITFDAAFDFGGNRLAIARDSRHCVAASYYVDGIALYSTSDGSEVWRRKDLKKAQHVAMSQDDRRVICGFDAKPAEVLDRETGRSVGTLRGVRNLWESPYGAIRLLEAKSLLLEQGVGLQRVIPRKTFGVLDVAFGPEHVCISEAGGPVRCISVRTGDEIWLHEPSKGEHYLSLGYSENIEAFVGVVWPYERGGPQRLSRFVGATGQPTLVADLGQSLALPVNAFCKHGSLLVTGTGSVFAVATGECINRLPLSGAAHDGVHHSPI